jgi:hypothetical protein
MGSRNTVPTVRTGRRSAQETGAAPGHQLNVTALCCWQCQGCSSIPFKMLRIVPLGDFHIFFSLNSFTRASSGVMVAHLMPTPTLCSVCGTPGVQSGNWQHHMRPSSCQRTCRHETSLTPTPASAGGIAATPKISYLDGVRRINRDLVIGLIPVRQPQVVVLDLHVHIREDELHGMTASARQHLLLSACQLELHVAQPTFSLICCQMTLQTACRWCVINLKSGSSSCRRLYSA